MKTSNRHVVWDWNSTLFDDAHAVMAATNDIFVPYNVRLTPEQYRAAFAHPLSTFYSTVLGREVDDEEFRRLDEGFHASYLIHMDECRLAVDAHQALTLWRDAGHTQSLLSLWTHDKLTALVQKLELAEWFISVQGRTDHMVRGKSQPLVDHLAALGIAAENVTLIGDSLNDAQAASDVGAHCVLYTGGTHEHAALAATGFPVVTSLFDAVNLAL